MSELHKKQKKREEIRQARQLKFVRLKFINST